MKLEPGIIFKLFPVILSLIILTYFILQRKEYLGTFTRYATPLGEGFFNLYGEL